MRKCVEPLTRCVDTVGGSTIPTRRIGNYILDLLRVK